MARAILAHPFGERLIAQELVRLGRKTNTTAMIPEIAARLALNDLLEVGLCLVLTRAARVNGRSVWRVRIRYYGHKREAWSIAVLFGHMRR